jgi:hypothetical protein
MKVAKVEIKLVLASFLLGYDYRLVDSTGQQPKELPVQDRNDIHQVGVSWSHYCTWTYATKSHDQLGTLFTLSSSAWLTRNIFLGSYVLHFFIFFAVQMIYQFVYQQRFQFKVLA